MNIFFGILTIIIMLLVFAEKDDRKRKHLTVCYSVTVGASLLISIVKIITVLL